VNDDRDLFEVWLASRLKGVRHRAALAAPLPALSMPSRRGAVLRLTAAACLAILAIAGLVTAALVAHRAAPTVGPTPSRVVPWRDLPATGSISPVTVPGVGPCSIDNLRITFPFNPNAGGARNSSTWQTTVSNLSGKPCFVAPTLLITFIAPSGPMHVAPDPQIQAARDILYLSPANGAPVGSPPYPSSVSGEIGTSGDCTIPQGTRLLISLGPSLGAVTFDPGPGVSSGPPCARGVAPTQGYYAELFDAVTSCCGTSVGGPDTVVQRPLTFPLIDGPTVVHPGDRVRFVVTVIDEYRTSHSNGQVPPPAALTLRPCPTYQQELEGADGSASLHTLNCDVAKPIPAGTSEQFEMFISVPSTAPQGPSILAWTINAPSGPATGRLFLEIA
jgi:hypothetical protein